LQIKLNVAFGSKAPTLTVCQALPVYPDKRTISEPVGMSQKCTKRRFNGGRDLGDDGPAAITHETGHQTEACRPAAKLILPMKFYGMAFFIIHMERRNGARTE